MIQVQTNLNVADNSGARIVQCIKVLGGSRKRVGKVGDIIRVSVKKVLPTSKVKKGEVRHALIVRTRKPISRPDGTKIKFLSNDVVLIDKQLNLVGTRVFGPLPYEVKKSNVLKLISLSEGIV